MKEKEIIINERMLGYSDEDIKLLLQTKGKRMVVRNGLFKYAIQYSLQQALDIAKEAIKHSTARLPDDITLVRWLIRYKNCKKGDCVTKEGNDNWFYPVDTRLPGKDSRWVMKKFTETLFRLGWNFRSDHKTNCQTNIEMNRAKEEAAYKALLNK